MLKRERRRPFGDGPAPLSGERPSSRYGPLPRGDGPLPCGDGPLPRRDGPLPCGDGRLPCGEGPLPRGDGPLPEVWASSQWGTGVSPMRASLPLFVPKVPLVGRAIARPRGEVQERVDGIAIFSLPFRRSVVPQAGRRGRRCGGDPGRSPPPRHVHLRRHRYGPHSGWCSGGGR